MPRDSVGDFFTIPGWKPPINLPVQDECPPANEEECDAVFYCRAKLFRHHATAWKLRAAGHLLILRDEKSARFIFLQARTRTMAANCLLNHNAPYNELRSSTSRCWVFAAQDFSDGVLNVVQFAVKFETAELASQFSDMWHMAKTIPHKMKALPDIDKEMDKDVSEVPDPPSESDEDAGSPCQTSKDWFAPPASDTEDDIEQELMEIPGYTPLMALEILECYRDGPAPKDEIEHSSHRAMLYRFRDKQWKERGVGVALILRAANGNIRFVMRNERTLRVIANFKIVDLDPYCVLKPHADTLSWVFCAEDCSDICRFADGDEQSSREQFLIKFATEELRNAFGESWESAKALLKSQDTKDLRFHDAKDLRFQDVKESERQSLYHDALDDPTTLTNSAASSSTPLTRDGASSLALEAHAAMRSNDYSLMTTLARRALLEGTEESRRIASDLTCMIALDVYSQQRAFHNILLKRHEERRHAPERRDVPERRHAPERRSAMERRTKRRRVSLVPGETMGPPRSARMPVCREETS